MSAIPFGVSAVPINKSASPVFEAVMMRRRAFTPLVPLVVAGGNGSITNASVPYSKRVKVIVSATVLVDAY